MKSGRWSWEYETALPKKRDLERAISRSFGISAASGEGGRAESARVARESWTKSRRCMDGTTSENGRMKIDIFC